MTTEQDQKQQDDGGERGPYSQEEAVAALTWLSGTAGSELVVLAGGALHQPVFDDRSVEYLDGIEETVKRLKQYARKNKLDDGQLVHTPLDAAYESQPEELQQHRKTDEELEEEAEEQQEESEKAATVPEPGSRDDPASGAPAVAPAQPAKSGKSEGSQESPKSEQPQSRVEQQPKGGPAASNR